MIYFGLLLLPPDGSFSQALSHYVQSVYQAAFSLCVINMFTPAAELVG